jgi:succinate-semialdehyde dehydrogenase/glutarate-semialdehyde dehydrogenase
MAIVTRVETPAGERRRLRLASPATRETLYEIEIQNADDAAQALEAARKAQPAWSALSFAERGRYLLRALDVLVERQDEFIDTIQRESGKARSEALAFDVFPACDSIAYYAKHTERLLRPEKKRLHGLLRFSKQLRIAYKPLGVVGVISPWNTPFILSLNPTVQALMGGNSVILKPSEVTPFSGRLVADLFESVGLPSGVLTVLTGDAETGAALVETGVDKIAFTGSVATGRRVAEACARQLIPCTLELGGKDPMIVCDDADLDAAAGGAIAGAFINTGQCCCGTERVYVVEEVADAFIQKVVERTSRLRQGDCGEFDVGSLFLQRQIEIVEEHVEDAIAKGATVRAGGRRNPEFDGLYYEPTVLVDVTHDMKIMRAETFGPVLPIMRVRDEEEAIARANDTHYGLSASVWTRDKEKGFEIAQRIESGSVCVNDMAMSYAVAEAPFGGRRQSGIGQVNGEVGLKSYCSAQPVLIDRFGGKRAAGTYPYSFAKDARAQKLIRFLYGTPFGRWLT